MNRWTKRCMAFVLTLTIICTSISAVKPTVETTYAATVQNITKSTKVVCRKTVAVKAPSGYKNCKYSSTNPKVASIDAKGKLKALRLGVTTITVKSGTEKKSYTITVVPEKKSDVRLNQELILGGQMVQLKLVSDKYDTSQESCMLIVPLRKLATGEIVISRNIMVIRQVDRFIIRMGSLPEILPCTSVIKM